MNRVTLLLTLVLTACGSDDEVAAGAGGTGGGGADGGGEVPCGDDPYCDEANWLCRPGMTGDYCAEEQTLTVLGADGATTTESLPKAEAPAVDCFYVYPTVALTQPVGNVADFSNVEDVLVPLRAQAAPFSALCRVFAPFYHQITLSTFGTPGAEAALETAYADVEAAFETYLRAWSGGRDFILLGHSQGAHMLRRLLQRRIETNAALRERLVVALPIGSVGDITVPVGQLRGGTFEELSLCSSREERDCVITYDALNAAAQGAGGVPPGATRDLGCVNPAAVGSGEVAPFRETLIPTRAYAGQFGAATAPDYPTTFLSLRGFYSGACARGSAGTVSLQVSFTPPSGASIESPVNLETQLMHLLDYSFPMGDLLDVVQAKIQARP